MTLDQQRPATRDGGIRHAVVGLDLGLTGERAADGVAHRLARSLSTHPGTGLLIATHAIGDDRGRRVAVTLSAAGVAADAVRRAVDALDMPPGEPIGTVFDGIAGGAGDGGPALLAVAAAHRHRTGGRVVVFDGSDGLPPTVAVGDLLADTGIDRVRVLGGGVAHPDLILHTRGFLRPHFVDGVIELAVQPAAGGTLVPFETPFPTPCCAEHS